MSSISTLLISDASSEINQRIEKLIRSHPELAFESQINKQRAPESIKGRKNILVWYELDTNTELSLVALQRLVTANPSIFFIVSKGSLDPDLVKTVMKFGVIDFLDYDRADAQLKSVIRRISALQDAETRAAAPAASTALEKRSQLKTSENLMQTGKWADFDFKKLQEGAALADAKQGLTSPAPVAPPSPSPAQASPAPQDAQVSKWGDLDAIGTSATKHHSEISKEDLFPQESSTEISSLSSLTSDSADGGSKWGDLDSIPTPGGKPQEQKTVTAPAPSGFNKGLGSSSLAMKSSDNLPKSGQSKWGDLDFIGASSGSKTPQIDPAVLQPTPPPTNKSKWGDLDAIGTAEAHPVDEVPVPNPYAQLDEVEVFPDSGAGRSKWGDLDSIGALSSSKTPQIDPVVLQPTPPPTNKSKWGDLDAIGAPAAKQNQQIDPAVLQPNPPSTNKSKWGDLDAIGTPNAQSPSPAPTQSVGAAAGGGSKWGDLDSIKTPAVPIADEGGSKWGNLDSIPTPKKASAPAPIEMPQAEKTPVHTPIAMGASRSSESRSASKKWVADRANSDHGGKMSSLREPKAVKISFKIGWEVWRVIIAFVLVMSAVLLSYKFFTY